jgi:hypothetical protein
MSVTILTAFSTHSSFEVCVLTLLDSSQVAMSLTSALCKPIATASSTSNCCKCLANLTMTLHNCPRQKRNNNGKHLRLATSKDRSDRKRVKSVKNTSSASKSKTIPQHKQCKRSGCVSRGTSLTHTHAQCFYKTDNTKGSSPTTNLLAKKEKTPHYTKPNPTGPPTRATSGPIREAFKPGPGSSSANKPRKDPSEVDCWTCGKKGHYSGDCPSNTKRKSLLSKNKPFRSLLAKQAFTPAQTQATIRIMDTYNQSVCHNCLVHDCRGHNCDANDREIHDAIPDAMAVLHENPDLQQPGFARRRSWRTLRLQPS